MNEIYITAADGVIIPKYDCTFVEIKDRFKFFINIIILITVVGVNYYITNYLEHSFDCLDEHILFCEKNYYFKYFQSKFLTLCSKTDPVLGPSALLLTRSI